MDFPAPEMEPESAHVVSAVLRSLAPMRRLQCSTTQATFTNPSHSALLRYSVECLIQLPNVIDTMSKRWRSKKAFNISPSHIFPEADSYSIPF